MKNSNKSAKSGRRRLLTILCIVLAVVLAVMLAVTVYVEHLFGKINYQNPDETIPTLSQEEVDALEEETESRDPEFSGPVIDEEDVDWGEGPDVAIGGNSDSIINILLIGQDTRGSKRARSDSMILMTFNRETDTLTMTSFMRDLYVKIPGYRDNRINAAYAYGGFQLLNDTLRENFGIHVDGNVEVDFSQFAKIIDFLGGVNMDLTTNEARYINRCLGKGHLKTGNNLLNGDQALMYARTRGIDRDGDFSRTDRQRKLLTELINTYKNSSITTILGLLDEILPMITTDMTSKEIIDYATELLPMVKESYIVTQHIPVEGGFYPAEIRGMQVLVPDLEKNVQALVDSLS